MQSQKGTAPVYVAVSLCNLQLALPATPPAPFAAKPRSGCITTTGSALAVQPWRLSEPLGRVWPPQTADRVLPHNKPCVTEKESTPETGYAAFGREGANASFLTSAHPQITPKQRAIANGFPDIAALVMALLQTLKRL